MTHKQDVTGRVFKIQRHALHDGPGIRTLVFLKGCPLRCQWCFNPESHSTEPQVLRYPDKCLGCGECLEVCPAAGALVIRNNTLILEHQLCTGCGLCSEVCPSGAMSMAGETMSVHRVVKEVLKDKVFYERSGGGLTLSGGEVGLQAEFAAAVLQECRALGVHTAIETSGHVPWTGLKNIIHFTDLVLYDLKMMDSDRHMALTGSGNRLILQNARLIDKTDCRMIIRIPLVPGCNDSPQNLDDTASFITKNLPGVSEVHVLPYELIGINKYERLGKSYALEYLNPPTGVQVQEAGALLETHGFKVLIKG